VKLKYIFDRDHMQDPFDESIWDRGEVRGLQDKHAQRLLRHPDCWEVTDEDETGEPVTPAPILEVEEEQPDLIGKIPQLDRMNRPTMVALAAREFHMRLDENMPPAEMRAQLTKLLYSRRA
jgi:hypothetical protein